MSFVIYVEGDADFKFIKDSIKFHFKYTLSESEIYNLRGKDRIEGLVNELRKNRDKKIQNVIILDADYKETNSGFIKTKNHLEQLKLKYDVEFDYFLLPNHEMEEDGDLEVLLEKIAKSKTFGPVFKCFEGYVRCLESESKNFKIPDRKTKIYAATAALLNQKKRHNDPDYAHEKNRDYLNSELWNLEDDAVKPLKDFLSTYFESKPTTT